MITEALKHFRVFFNGTLHVFLIEIHFGGSSS